MKLLCGTKNPGVSDSLCCFNIKKTTQDNQFKPYIITIKESNILDNQTLYKVNDNFETRWGFSIPNKVYVIYCNTHSYGMAATNETPIIIPIVDEQDDVELNNSIFITVPSRILSRYEQSDY